VSENYSALVIDDELVQGEAESCLERKLSTEELDQVFDRIYGEWPEFIQDRIENVVSYNEMLELNKNMEKKAMRFDLYYRNVVALMPEFRRSYSFKTEDDAREYVLNNFCGSDDEWKLVYVEGKHEREIWSIPERKTGD